MILSQLSPVQFRLGRQGNRSEPPTPSSTSPQTLNKLNAKEFKVNQKTKVDGLYEETPKQFSDSTPNPYYCPKDTKRQSTPLSEDEQEEDILQDISVNNITNDILNFNPNNPIHSIPATSTDPLYAFNLTPVSEHLDPTDPEQFRIDFSSITTSAATSDQQPMPPTPHPDHQQQQSQQLEQQGQSAQHLQGVQGPMLYISLKPLFRLQLVMGTHQQIHQNLLLVRTPLSTVT